MADIDAIPNLKNKPDWFKKYISGVGDVLSRYMDAQSNQTYLSTAFTRRRVFQLLELINYNMRGKSTSSGTQRFNISPSASFPLAISKADLAAITQASLSITALRFESRLNESFTPVIDAFTVVDTVENTIETSLVYDTGDLIRVTSTGAMPDPLTAGTDYYVIYVDDTHIKLAVNYDDAYAGVEIDLTTVGTGARAVVGHALKIDVWQQTSVINTVIGQSDGIQARQEHALLHQDVLKDTVEITAGLDIFTQVTEFLNSLSTDKHFKMITNTDLSSNVLFGDGTYGEIPANGNITATYSYGGGSISNVSVINRVNLYAGTSLDIINTANVTEMSGGENEEDIESAKFLGPELLRTFDRFVKTSDGIALVTDFGGIARVRINKNKFGLLTTEVVIIPVGGGATSPAFKASIKEHLEKRSVLETIVVYVVDAGYISIDVTSQFNINPGFVFADVKSYYDFAIQFFFSERNQDIINEYNSKGIADAVTLINSYFLTSFITTDYNQVERLIVNLEITPLGQPIDEIDLTSYLRSYVNGVNNINVDLPLFPILIGDNETTTDGIITTTAL
jgi:hypothetical protein